MKNWKQYPGRNLRHSTKLVVRVEEDAPILGLQRTRETLIDCRRNTDNCNSSQTEYINVPKRKGVVLPDASTRHEQIPWCWNISALVEQNHLYLERYSNGWVMVIIPSGGMVPPAFVMCNLQCQKILEPQPKVPTAFRGRFRVVSNLLSRTSLRLYVLFFLFKKRLLTMLGIRV